MRKIRESREIARTNKSEKEGPLKHLKDKASQYLFIDDDDENYYN